mgnify:CR=1 FL=1
MKPKVLLVEDDIALQETFKEYLEEKYQVVMANTGMIAAQILKDGGFSIILVDLGLPDMSGMNVIKLAAKSYKDSAVLALTGDRTSKSVQEAITLGVDDYLVKPIDSDHLHNRIEKVFLKKKAASDPF